MSTDEKYHKIAEPSERGFTEHSSPDYVLKLYIAGHTTRSIQAITAAKAFCEAHLLGRYHLEIIDIYQYPDATEAEQIISVPTLVRKLPLPQRKLVGDITNEARLRTCLGLDKDS